MLVLDGVERVVNERVSEFIPRPSRRSGYVEVTRSMAHVKGALNRKYLDRAAYNWRAANPTLSPTLIHLYDSKLGMTQAMNKELSHGLEVCFIRDR